MNNYPGKQTKKQKKLLLLKSKEFLKQTIPKGKYPMHRAIHQIMQVRITIVMLFIINT